jgi:hypothetical protein
LPAEVNSSGFLHLLADAHRGSAVDGFMYIMPSARGIAGDG